MKITRHLLTKRQRTRTCWSPPYALNDDDGTCDMRWRWECSCSLSFGFLVLVSRSRTALHWWNGVHFFFLCALDGFLSVSYDMIKLPWLKSYATFDDMNRYLIFRNVPTIFGFSLAHCRSRNLRSIHTLIDCDGTLDLDDFESRTARHIYSVKVMKTYPFIFCWEGIIRVYDYDMTHMTLHTQ